MVGMPIFFGQFFIIFWARFLARLFGTENTVCSPTGTEKYSGQYHWAGNIQFYNTTGTEKRGSNTVLKNPYCLNPTYSKPSCMCASLSLSIYIYMYTHIYIHIYYTYILSCIYILAGTCRLQRQS